jgi:hypothetical protein
VNLKSDFLQKKGPTAWGRKAVRPVSPNSAGGNEFGFRREVRPDGNS